ncbi:MAG: EFR1 family ferrodoxin [Endomicrobia bacterium]|nr:EFR1 family ferrodoxin [Endomicrobiia bacterium]
MKNNSVDIYFFTGTGNSYLAAKRVAKVLEQNGCGVNLLDLAKSEPEKADLSKTIGIFFPVACWNTYPLVRNFIKKLPKAAGTEVFVCSTMGGSSMKAAANIGSILSRKGYSVIASKGFVMPNNFIAVKSEEKNAAIREKAYTKMESFALDIVNGAAKPESTNIFFELSFLFTSFITGLWESGFSQKIMKFNLIKEHCTKCGLCADICPVKNISMADYPAFDGNKCQFCMRCISYCPSNAISKIYINKTYRALDAGEMKECFQKKY